MQKIQSYLYPNRIILLANLAGFTVENTIVYQRTVKIYNGIDNTLEFDIQNADQKRIDLTGFSQLELNLMDAAGNALNDSPYTVTPMNQTSLKGLATVTIPAGDLVGLNDQFLKFSVTGIKAGAPVILYTDSRFGAVGTMELNGSAVPLVKPDRVYQDFAGEINFMGNVITHTPAIPAKFYEAQATQSLNFSIDATAFIGTLYIEGTRDMTISVNSFLNATKIVNIAYTVATTTTINFNDILVGDYNYFRVSWVYPDVWQFGSQSTLPFGSIDKVTVSS